MSHDPDIGENLERLQARIHRASKRCGRGPEDIRLVAVSKGRSADKIRLAYDLGLRDFGENRVYEALGKIEQLSDLDDIRWHMIGHVQSRKARDIAPRFHTVHSVDRNKIAGRLNRYAGEAGRTIPILLQCNVSGEDTKGGWNVSNRDHWPRIVPEFSQISEAKHLEVLGLMTIAPLTEDADRIRSCFRALRELREYLEPRCPGNWSQLSMGMSNDFEIAIAEGATILRIGTAVFGPLE